MNPRNDGPVVNHNVHENRAGNSLAALGLFICILVIGLGAAGGVYWHQGRNLAAVTVPSQDAEPELESTPGVGGENSPEQLPANRRIQLANHEALTPDAEQLDADLDELGLAEAAAVRGQWSEAAKAYAKVTMDPPVPLHVWYHRQIACMKIGDKAGYRTVCESLLDRVEMDPQNLPPINLVAWMRALAPDAVTDHRRPIVLAELLLARLPDEPVTQHAYLNTIGAVFLRAGRFEEAVKHLKKGIAATDDGGAKQDWLLLALAHHHLGQPAEARRCLAKIPADSALNGRNHVWDSAEIELLWDEVLKTMSPR